MRRLLTIAGALGLLAAAGCGKPAQIGPDEEAHKATDATQSAGSRTVVSSPSLAT